MLPVCAIDIAAHYAVDLTLVRAIAQVESRQQNPGVVGPNSNGTYDIGIMQINTWWLKQDGPYSLKGWGIDQQTLLSNDCTNIAVGVWILKTNLDRYTDERAALSAYNTGRPNSKAGAVYATKVLYWRNKYERTEAEVAAAP